MSKSSKSTASARKSPASRKIPADAPSSPESILARAKENLPCLRALMDLSEEMIEATTSISNALAGLAEADLARTINAIEEGGPELYLDRLRGDAIRMAEDWDGSPAFGYGFGQLLDLVVREIEPFRAM
jgi:hypothetical protein